VSVLQAGSKAGHRGDGDVPGHPQPVFILAPARSYSTVALAVLAGHPDIYGFPEMLVFDAPDVAGVLNEGRRRPWQKAAWVRDRLSGVLRATAELELGGQSPENIERARRWLEQRSDWTMIRLMNHFLALVSPRVGLEKSPETARTDQALDACLQAYPRARYLHLTRHPVTTQRSMHVHWGELPLTRRELIVRSAASWYLVHARIVRRLARLPGDQWMRVRAEDLLREPAIWLPRVLEWLGLPSCGQTVAQMLRTEEWRFAGRGESGNLFGGDPSFFYSSSLRAVPEPGPVVFDPAWGLHDKTCQQMIMLAEYLGY
jgi:hypothetical protein